MGGLAYLVQEALPFEEAGEEGAGAEDLPAGELGGGHRLPHPAYGPGQDLEGPLAEAAPSGWEASPFTAAWGTLCPGAERAGGGRRPSTPSCVCSPMATEPASSSARLRPQALPGRKSR
jgi:hypothetical protein